MGFTPAVSSGGHTGFYSVLGFTLAAFLLPWYDHYTALIQTGFGLGLDTVVLTGAVGSALSAILYATSPDALIDQYIVLNSKYESKRELLKWPSKRKLAQDSIMQISRIDYLTSSWRRVTWKSSREGWTSSVNQSADDSAIKNVLWAAKNKSGIGLSLMMWAIILRFLGIAIWFVFVIGLVLFFAPWLRNDIFSISLRLRELSILRYAQDTMTWWIPSFRERSNQWLVDSIEIFKVATKEIHNIIVSSQWRRLDLLYSWLIAELDAFSKRPLDIDERLYEQLTIHFLEITKRKGGKLDYQDLVTRYQAIVDAFQLNGYIGANSWPEKAAEEIGNLPFWLSIPYSFNELKKSIRGFLDDFTEVFWGYADSALWVNHLVTHRFSDDKDVRQLIFQYALMETDELSDDVYRYLLNTGEAGLPLEKIPPSLFDKLKPHIKDEDRHRGFLSTLVKNPEVDIKIRRYILYLSDRLSNSFGMELARILWTPDLAPELKDAVAELRRRLGLAS